ncbi:hypothetical protein MKEN_01157400 [Mycena kentingensis (nom. inval.)]|nr:hypothetical protein MKEN_01157400 [Mycena kentingensis (nom. inval.)]
MAIPRLSISHIPDASAIERFVDIALTVPRSRLGAWVNSPKRRALLALWSTHMSTAEGDPHAPVVFPDLDPIDDAGLAVVPPAGSAVWQSKGKARPKLDIAMHTFSSEHLGPLFVAFVPSKGADLKAARARGDTDVYATAKEYCSAVLYPMLLRKFPQSIRFKADDVKKLLYQKLDNARQYTKQKEKSANTATAAPEKRSRTKGAAELFADKNKDAILAKRAAILADKPNASRADQLQAWKGARDELYEQLDASEKEKWLTRAEEKKIEANTPLTEDEVRAAMTENRQQHATLVFNRLDSLHGKGAERAGRVLYATLALYVDEEADGKVVVDRVVAGRNTTTRNVPSWPDAIQINKRALLEWARDELYTQPVEKAVGKKDHTLLLPDISASELTRCEIIYLSLRIAQVHVGPGQPLRIPAAGSDNGGVSIDVAPIGDLYAHYDACVQAQKNGKVPDYHIKSEQPLPRTVAPAAPKPRTPKATTPSPTSPASTASSTTSPNKPPPPKTPSPVPDFSGSVVPPLPDDFVPLPTKTKSSKPKKQGAAQSAEDKANTAPAKQGRPRGRPRKVKEALPDATSTVSASGAGTKRKERDFARDDEPAGKAVKTDANTDGARRTSRRRAAPDNGPELMVQMRKIGQYFYVVPNQAIFNFPAVALPAGYSWEDNYETVPEKLSTVQRMYKPLLDQN